MNSEIVVQEKKGHWEGECSSEEGHWEEPSGYRNSEDVYARGGPSLDGKWVVDSPKIDNREYITDEPAVTEPNIEIRKNARTELINLKYTLWFFQYKARERIDELLLKQKSKDEIELDLVYQSIDYHRNGLSARRPTGKINPSEGYYKTICTNNLWIGGSRDGTNPGYWEDESTTPEYKEVFIETRPETPEYKPDLQKREASIRELKKLYQETRYKTAKNKIENVLGYAPGEKNENP